MKRLVVVFLVVVLVAWLVCLGATQSQLTKVTIAGTVRDASGKGIQTAISVDAFNLGDQGWIATDSNGRFSFRANTADQYIVTANPPRTDWQRGYSCSYMYMPGKKLLKRTGTSLTVDFVLQPAGTLWLRAYDVDGREMTRDEFASAFVGAFPPGELPMELSLQAQCNSEPLFWGWIENSTANTACMLLPATTPGAVWAMWKTPGAGTTFLHADNSGLGYSLQKGAIESVNLVYEFAATELRELAERSSEFLMSGHAPPASATEKIMEAHSLMSEARRAQSTRDWPAAAVKSYKVLENVILAREELELQKSRDDIAASRTQRIQLLLLDTEGRPLADASVEFEQVSHDFILSIGWPEPAQYAAFASAGFEYACFESWWGEIRRPNGTYVFPDAEIRALAGAGLGVVMHASVWLSPSYPPGVPASVSTMDTRELAEDVANYSRDVLRHSAGQIALYNALNEPDLQQAASLTLSEMIDVVNSSAGGAKQGDPTVLTYVNIAVPMMGYDCLDPVAYEVAVDAFGNGPTGRPIYDPPTASGLAFLRALYAAPTAVDVTGLEFYYGVVMPPIDLGLFSRILDAYGALGKPVFISELSYATLEDYPGLVKYWSSYGGRQAGYTDKAQADWAAAALTVAFSKPYVLGTQWVAANDGPPEYDFVGFGLFHSDGCTPRPALAAIGDLIEEWTARGDMHTDVQGRIQLAGTAGRYELRIRTVDGRRFRATLHLGPNIGPQVTLDCQLEAGG